MSLFVSPISRIARLRIARLRVARLRVVLVAGVCSLVAGCNVFESLLTDEDVDAAVIIHFADTTDITVADTVPRGAAFNVQMVTYGGGCTRSTVRTEVRVAGRVAEIRPYNKTKHLRGGGGGCDADLMFLRHQAQITIAEPGTFTIRVVGVQRSWSTNGENVPAEVTRVITVR
jgi:hypothetical protein